jgi:hypothetical protein
VAKVGTRVGRKPQDTKGIEVGSGFSVEGLKHLPLRRKGRDQE